MEFLNDFYSSLSTVCNCVPLVLEGLTDELCSHSAFLSHLVLFRDAGSCSDCLQVGQDLPHVMQVSVQVSGSVNL